MKALPPLASEFEACEFADLRLLDRVIKIATALEEAPEKSLPEAMKSRGQLEATYRFFSNDRVEFSDILAGHVEKTLERMAVHRTCLAVHDTSEFEFEGKRDGLGQVDRKGQGFYGHACLAVSADGQREPLGVLAFDIWTRARKKGKRTTAQRKGEPELESDRWLRQSTDVEAVVGGATRLIHVEDREGHIYRSLAARIEEGVCFIVRANSNRVALTEDGLENVGELLRRLPRRFTREVLVSARERRISLPKSKPARKERKTTLGIAATRIRLRRPLKETAGPAAIELNAVHVVELGELPDGEERIEWLLFTTEPIETQADLEYVVDCYRARWLIEEYFKALKTGCAYESRQLESLDALLRALGIFAVVAWRLLVLRFCERAGSAAPASSVATEAEIAVLQAKKLLPKNPTAAQFMNAVATYGGHLSNNGRPGFLVLWRGLQAIRVLAEGWALAQKSDES